MLAGKDVSVALARGTQCSDGCAHRLPTARPKPDRKARMLGFGTHPILPIKAP